MTSVPHRTNVYVHPIRMTEMERAFTQAMNAVERLLMVCHRAGIAPEAVANERDFYAAEIDRQAAFYGDTDGQS